MTWRQNTQVKSQSWWAEEEAGSGFRSKMRRTFQMCAHNAYFANNVWARLKNFILLFQSRIHLLRWGIQWETRNTRNEINSTNELLRIQLIDGWMLCIRINWVQSGNTYNLIDWMHKYMTVSSSETLTVSTSSAHRFDFSDGGPTSVACTHFTEFTFFVPEIRVTIFVDQ